MKADLSLSLGRAGAQATSRQRDTSRWRDEEEEKEKILIVYVVCGYRSCAIQLIQTQDPWAVTPRALKGVCVAVRYMPRLWHSKDRFSDPDLG